MRIPLKHGYTISVILGRDREKRFQVELWTQPWHRYLVAVVYHWYDMRIFKVPGFKKLENWLMSKNYAEALTFESLPLGCKQDLRCYDLSVKQRIVLARLPIDRETFKKLEQRSSDW